MSAGFEKETKSSTAKSLIGALSGLGAGFIFMFLGLVALSNATARVPSSEVVRPLREALEADLMSVERSSFHLSPDGTTLSFKARTASNEHKISYRVDGETNLVAREHGDVRRRMATLPGARFRSNNGLIVLTWRTPTGEARCSWAVDRWARGSKP